MSNTLRWYFSHLQDNQWGWRLDPKKSRREIFQRISALGIFLGQGEPLTATPLIVALSPWHRDITMFLLWSPFTTGNHRTAPKKFQHLLRGLARLTFLIRVQAFRAHFADSFRMSKSSWMMDPTRSCEMPRCSAIDLVEIQRSSKISSRILSIMSRVVTVFCRPGRGASQVEKSPRLNWTTQFLTVAHDGACSPYVSVIMAWISFSASTCREKKTLWQQASPCCWNRAPRLTCFLSASVTRKLAIRHMNRPLVPTALSIPSYDIG